MNATARTARQIVKARRAERAAAKAPHTLASHTLRAGIVRKDATSIAGALRAKGKATGVTGCAARMFRKNEAGQKIWRQPVKGARRYTKGEFLTLVAAYNPRAPRLVDAREQLLTY